MRLRQDGEGVRKALAQDLKSEKFHDAIVGVYAELELVPELDQFPQEVYPSVKWAPTVFPCGELNLIRGITNAPESNASDLTYEVMVFWHALGTDEQTIEDTISRLVGAVREFYTAKDHLQPWLMGTTVWLGDEDYSPVIPTDRTDTAPLAKSGAITVYVRVQH